MTVVSLDTERLKRGTHRSGPARCLNCGHTWIAVSPIGTVALECPQCKTDQGVYLGLAATEYMQWQCACGEWMFFIDQISPYCAHCGRRPKFVRCDP